MQKIVRRSIISGKVEAPASRAMAHRILVASCLSPGQTVVSGVPDTPDVHATINALAQLGADIAMEGAVVDIFAPQELNFQPKVDCGASNTALKLLLPLAAELSEGCSISADGTLQKSPIEPFALYLQRLGAEAQSSNGYLPINICGPTAESEMEYPASLGTQFLSGLLLAAPFKTSPTEIAIPGPIPDFHYVESTIELMKKFGIQFGEEEEGFIALLGEQLYVAPDSIEVGKSQYLSSFLLLAGAGAGSCEVMGIEECRGLGGLLQSFGHSLKYSEGAVSCGANVFSRAELDARQLGEMLPHAFILASLCSEECKFSGIASLPPKKEYRARLLARELSKMGVSITETDAGFFIRGGRLSGSEVDCEGDAKVAMALSVAALCASGATTIKGVECLEGIFPDFYQKLASLGAIVR